MRIIKRYSNRRLYDTFTSRTVTQVEVAELVSHGVDVHIVDNQSGEDVTNAVLGRAVLRETSSWNDADQVKEMFSEILITGGRNSMSVLKNTILASIGAFQVTKAKAEKIIDELVKKGDLDKSDRKKAVMELLTKAEESTASFRKKFGTEASKVTTEVSRLIGELKKHKLAGQADLKKLEGKIDRLSKKLSTLEKKLAN